MIAAYMNHGRWVVMCPADDCVSGVRVTGLQVRCDCNDEMVCDHPQIPCGALVEIEMPNDGEEITRLLNLRPHRVNRNWTPSETVADLKAENLLHGVKL